MSRTQAVVYHSHHFLGMGEGLPSMWSSMAEGAVRCSGGSAEAGEQSLMNRSLLFLL